MYEFAPTSRIKQDRRRVDKVRVEFPRIHFIAHLRRDPEHDDWNSVWTWAFPRTDCFHVNATRHCMERERKRRIVYYDFQKLWHFMRKNRTRTLVVSWVWIRKEAARNPYLQMEWKMGSSRWRHVAQLQWKRTLCIPWIQCFGTRRFESKGKGKLSFHFCGDDKSLKWFSARSSPWISSEITEQYRTCATNWISVCSESTGDLLSRAIQRPWPLQQNCW